MHTRDETLRVLQTNLASLQADYGVRRLAIFGSVARDKADEDSDVDVVVEFDRPVGLRFVDFAEHLEALLGRKTDVLTPAGLAAIRNPKIAKSIRKSLIYVSAL
jgi:predicted nucleotidyltransferase